ncbi:uncharacterized protein LOC106994708 isoform X2 [Macaca mulatta]
MSAVFGRLGRGMVKWPIKSSGELHWPSAPVRPAASWCHPGSFLRLPSRGRCGLARSAPLQDPKSRRDWSPQTRPIMVRKEHPCTGPSGDAEDGSCLPPRQGMGPAGKAALLPVPFPAHGSSSSRLHPSLLTVSWKQCASPTPQPSPSVYSPGKAEDLLRAWRAPAGLRLI